MDKKIYIGTVEGHGNFNVNSENGFFKSEDELVDFLRENNWKCYVIPDNDNNILNIGFEKYE